MRTTAMQAEQESQPYECHINDYFIPCRDTRGGADCTVISYKERTSGGETNWGASICAGAEYETAVGPTLSAEACYEQGGSKYDSNTVKDLSTFQVRAGTLACRIRKFKDGVQYGAESKTVPLRDGSSSRCSDLPVCAGGLQHAI